MCVCVCVVCVCVCVCVFHVCGDSIVLVAVGQQTGQFLGAACPFKALLLGVSCPG